MKEQIAQRLGVLKAEFDSGQKMLADLEAKQAGLRNTLIRMSGAIQVLEEELAKTSPSQEGGIAPLHGSSEEEIDLKVGATSR